MKRTTTKKSIRIKNRDNIRKNFKAVDNEIEIELNRIKYKEGLDKILKFYKKKKPTEILNDGYYKMVLEETIWDLMEYMNKFHKIKRAVKLEERKNENILKELEKG